jgi:hypothetical protein
MRDRRGAAFVDKEAPNPYESLTFKDNGAP